LAPCFHKYGYLLREEEQKLTVLRHFAMQMALFASHQLGWSLDEIAAPDWRSTPMAGPLFIVGHQRSGTTYLQRLLAANGAHVRSLTLLDIMLPSVSVQRALGTALGTVIREEASLARGLDVAVRRVEDRLFGQINPMHELRFQAPAEDEFVLWGIFASITCLNDSPLSSTMADPHGLRDFASWSEGERARAFGWYKACLLKKVHREPGASDGGPVWMVSKNPAFTHKILYLRESFPGARFVYLVRSPLQTIPSRLSLIREIWRARYSRFREMSPGQVQAILQDSYRTYRAAEEQLAGLPESTFLVVRYPELTEDPARVVSLIHERFGIPRDPDAPPALPRSKRAEAGGYESRHRYSLEDFSLSEEQVRAELGPIFARYGF
jgi:hypothetical protein